MGETPEVYQQPIYKKPPVTAWDEPHIHQSVARAVGADGFVGAGSYAIGQKNHVPSSTRSTGARTDGSRSALSPFFGKQ